MLYFGLVQLVVAAFLRVKFVQVKIGFFCLNVRAQARRKIERSLLTFLSQSFQFEVEIVNNDCS